jgi:hypothetical protein
LKINIPLDSLSNLVARVFPLKWRELPVWRWFAIALHTETSAMIYGRVMLEIDVVDLSDHKWSVWLVHSRNHV